MEENQTRKRNKQTESAFECMSTEKNYTKEKKEYFLS